MSKSALSYYLSNLKDHCKKFEVPMETCFEGEKIVSVFLDENDFGEVKIGVDNNGYLFQEEIDIFIVNEIIDHLLETEGIFIPIDE